MELKVIVGPSCSASLREGIQRGIWRRMGEDFSLTTYENVGFRDGEGFPRILQNIRGADVYIVQPTNPPAENFQTLQLFLQGAALASARYLTAVLPYMGGLRQDTKDRPRAPVTAALMAQMIEEAMGDRVSQRHVMVLHPHTKVHLAFRISCDSLYPTDIFMGRIGSIFRMDYSQAVSLSPDVGGIKLADRYSRLLGIPLAVGDKRRNKDDKPEVVNIIGNVEGKTAIIPDDIVDTAGTLLSLMKMFREKGGLDAYAFISHAILVDGAVENLLEAQSFGLRKVYVTNTINHGDRQFPADLIEFVDVGELIGRAIWENHTNGSISAIDGMFSNHRQ